MQTQIKLFSQDVYYVNSQTFEEKPFLLFSLLKSTNLKHNYEFDENGKYVDRGAEIIKETPYDEKILIAFEDSVKDHNHLYKANLNIEMFLLIKDLLTYKIIDKKTKLLIDNIQEAKIFINKTKDKKELIFEHIIYYLKNEYLFGQDRYWQALLPAVCGNFICSTNWLEDKIDFLLPKSEAHRSLFKNEIGNSHFIFSYIITPLLQNISSRLRYNDKIVQKYELLLFKRTKIAPFKSGLDILRSIAINTIINEQERNFILSKLGSFYYRAKGLVYSSLSYDEKDKNFRTIKMFVEDLNILAPVALKKVNKTTDYDSGRNEKMLVINHAGKDIGISNFDFAKDVNIFLGSTSSPYRLIIIPLALTNPDWNNNQYILFSLAFMNENEFNYFSEYYMVGENVKKWHIQERDEELQEIIRILKISDFLNPVFTTQTSTPFNEYKQSKLKSRNIIENNNIFLADVNWEWFKNKYIDELSSKESWYEIMNIICQCPKGKKPTMAWLSDLQKEIEKLGIEKYFKELQVLFSLSLKEESWFFDIYATALKGLIWSCGHIKPNDLSLSVLKTITEYSYTKIHGIGARSAITGNLALEALVASQKEEAFGILNIMRNKTKYNKFVVALEKNIEKFKETSTIPEQLLADKSIPTFDFKDGRRIFEIGDYKIIVSFQNKKLTKQYTDLAGNSLKKLPQLANEQTKKLKEINEEVKQINSIFNDLNKRIKTYWLYDRIWAFSDWNRYIKNHDFIYPHIEGLIWTNKTQNKDFIVLNNQLLDINNHSIISNPEDEICLWHPVLNNEDNISRWQNYLWLKKVVQSQRQAFRENYPFSNTELELLETPRFAHHFLEVQKLMAVANNVGWIFTYVHEGENWPRVYLKPLNVSAHLICDYDRNGFAIPTKQVYFTKDNSTKINDYRPKQSFEKIKLSEIPLVTLSEICRDIDLFISTTSIANNVELSENKQEYKSYRTEYQKGLFSDNTNAKIRKQIIEKIAPILKLNIEKFEGNFVIINGKSDTYKINLNSGFAQLNETQKHINLLPNIKKLKSDKNVRLPIEDDETLYIILAKIIHLQTI